MITLRKVAAAQQEQRHNVIVADFLAGVQNSSNQTFNTTYNYIQDRITVYYNGQGLHSPYDFSQTGSNEIEFIYIKPLPGDKLRATYEVDGAFNVRFASGRQQLFTGDLERTVFLGTTMSGTNYRVNAELVTSDGSPCVYSYVLGDKTTTSFKVYLSGAMENNNYALEWMVID